MALSCDVCGGGVTGGGGGVFVCDACGARYNIDWARAQTGAAAPQSAAPQPAAPQAVVPRRPTEAEAVCRQAG